MSSVNGNGRGNILISYLFKTRKLTNQVSEEAELKILISQLLIDKGYKFSVSDDEIIDKKLLGDDWIKIDERYPTREEYIKNDGRFIVTDGNRVYQSLYNVYDEKCFVEVAYHEIEIIADKNVVAWRNMPDLCELHEDEA